MYRLVILLLICTIGQVSITAQCTFAPVDVSGMECTSATFICGDELDGYSGSLQAGVTPGIQPPNFCGSSSAENIEWLSFVTCEADVEIRLTYTNCSGGILPVQGFQAGVYSSCDFVNDFVVCETGNGSFGVITLSFTSTPGIHFLFLDGFAGSVCNYEIEVVSGVGMDPFDPLTPQDNICRPVDILMPDSAVINLCVEEIQQIRTDLEFPPTFDFCGLSDLDLSSILDGEPFFCVETCISPNTGYTIISGNPAYIDYNTPSSTTLSNIQIQWNEPGTYSITHKITGNPALPECSNIDTTCTDVLTVIVREWDTIMMAVDTICEIDSYSFCDSLYYESGTYECLDNETCRLTIQPLYVIPKIEEQLGTIYVCDDQCFEVYNTPYCIPGNYSVGGASNCDTFFLFSLVELDLETSMGGDSLITCTTPTVTLTGNYTTSYPDQLSTFWTNAAGDTISMSDVLMTSMAGTYVFHAVPTLYPGCEVMHTVNVMKDDNIPTLNINSPVLSCNDPTGQLSASASNPIVSYMWNGPNNYMSIETMPTISDTGSYTLSVIADNGCMSDTTFTVFGDFEVPSVILDYVNLDCNTTSAEASYAATGIVSQLWTDPSSSIFTTPTIDYNMPGEYLLSLTASNGCTLDTMFEILDLSYIPSLGMHKDTFWRCATEEITYQVSMQNDLTSIWSTGDGDFTLVGDTFTAYSTGTYYLSITDDVLGCNGIDTLVIAADVDTLSAMYTVTDPSCFGYNDGSIELTYGEGEPPYLITINGIASLPEDLDQLAAGIYSINITDAFGCMLDTTITLLDPDEVLITSATDISVKYSPEVTLTVEHNVEDGNLDNITWYDPTSMILSTGSSITTDNLLPTYGVRVEDIFGCSDSTAINFNIDYSVAIHYPTIFSPNGDSNNDRWIPYSSGFPQTINSLKVYDRWGNLVYLGENIDYNNEDAGWDGNHNGQACRPGVFVFMINFMQADGKMLTDTGTITLVR